MKRLHMIVSGRVQGVFYRAAVREVAAQFPITGYVKNLSDGTVEIVAEGEESELKRFAGKAKINDDIREATDSTVEYTDIPHRKHHSFFISR